MIVCEIETEFDQVLATLVKTGHQRENSAVAGVIPHTVVRGPSSQPQDISTGDPQTSYLWFKYLKALYLPYIIMPRVEMQYIQFS